MNYDWADDVPKLVVMLVGIAIFVAVVGLILLLVSLPEILARRRGNGDAVAAGTQIGPAGAVRGRQVRAAAMGEDDAGGGGRAGTATLAARHDAPDAVADDVAVSRDEPVVDRWPGDDRLGVEPSAGDRPGVARSDEARPPARGSRRAGDGFQRQRMIQRYQVAMFLGPALLLLLIGLIIPAIRTTILSFMDRTGTDWVGLANYEWMIGNSQIMTVLRNTFIWVAVGPILSTAIGLIYAVVVDKSRFEKVAKSLIFLPMAISFVGAGIIWGFVYAYRPTQQDQIGLLNQVLPIESQNWLLIQPLNTFLLIVVMVWIQAGFATVILSAAIKGIPADTVEAARMDGANPWQMFWRITIPSIRPALVVVMVTISIATLKVFDIVRTMTGGQFGTSVVANEMYNQAFRAQQPGQGAALAVVLFVLVLPIVFYQIRSVRQRREIA